MADDDSKGKSKGFLKKSKWGKLFKEDDASPNLKLSDDVVDFLKPSTDNARFATVANPPPAPRGPTTAGGPPKLSIAVAQRFPAANEVRPAAATSTQDGPASPLPPTLFNGKPKRRRGLHLVVGFARTPPDIMGEGGDEAPDPPSEIGRMKAALSRSVSERRVPSEPYQQTQQHAAFPPGAQQSLAAGPYSTSRSLNPAGEQGQFGQGPHQVAQQPQSQSAYQPRQYQSQYQPNQAPSNGQTGSGGNATRGQQDDSRPGPLRRVNTSHNEVSPPVQKRTAAPPPGPRHVHKSSLGRVPTGFSAHVQDSPEDPMTPSIVVQDHTDPSEHGRPSSRIRPTVDTSAGMTGGKKQYTGLSPISPAALKAREMRTNEGATFRRASMLMLRDEAGEDAEDGSGDGGSIHKVDWDDHREKEREAERAAERAAEKERNEQMERQRQYEAQSQQYGPPRGQQPSQSSIGSARQRAPTVEASANDDFGSRAPRTVDSPTEHNPFADPKFLKRSSRETASESLSTYPSQQRAPSQSSQPQQQSQSRPIHSFSRPIQGGEAYSPPLQQQEQHQRTRQDSQGQHIAAHPAMRNVYPSATQDAQRPAIDTNRASPMRDLAQSSQQRTDQTTASYQSQQTQSPESYYQPSQRPAPRIAGQRSFRGDEGAGYASAAASNASTAGFSNNQPASRNRQYSEPQQGPGNYGNSGDGLAIRPGPAGLGLSSGQQSQMLGGTNRSRDVSPNTRDRAYTHSYLTQSQRQQLQVDGNGGEYANGSSARMHTRTVSHDSNPSQRNSPASAGLQQPTTISPRFAHHFAPQPAQGSTSRPQASGNAGQSAKAYSPNLRQQSTEQFPQTRSSPMKQNPPSVTASPAGNVPQRQVSGASQSQLAPPARPSLASQVSQDSNPAADAAFADFCARVAHMRGVFSLTAEKEQTRDKSSPTKWLRAAAWWFLKGKAGVEGMMRTVAPQDPGQPRRELLAQPHVDLAKAWWIIMDPLQLPNASEGGPHNASAVLLRNALKSICLMMGRNGLLPPTHALIQGQNTNIWLDYPRFRADVTAILGGDDYGSTQSTSNDAFEMMPLGDTRDYFCYGRFQVDAYINTDDPETDRIPLPCMFSIMRSRRDYQMDIAIVSQSDLITVRVSPRTTERRLLSWQDVSWKPTTFGMVVHLQRNVDLNVRLQERDYRYVRGLAEYARGVERDIVENADERLVHESSLAELQYSDSANNQAFPSEKLRACTAHIYERFIEETDGNGRRKKHRGFRFLLTTDVGQKTLSSVTHELGRKSPIFVELVSDKIAAANGQAILVLRVREDNRQCRAIMTFGNPQDRQAFHEALNALAVGPTETIVEKLPLTSLSVEPLEGSPSQAAAAALQSLQWQKLGVTNTYSDDPNNRLAGTVESESLRILLRHTGGCIVDRLNLSKGEFLFRLPASSTSSNSNTSIQLLRQAQLDMTMSLDSRAVPQPASDALSSLLQTIQQAPTIRTFTFPSPAELHAFQASLTGYTIVYDGTAATLAIARRRMVVPIYKKWEAAHVRLQIVSKASHQPDGGVVRVLAFFADGSFSHADALCFRVLGTDVFENVKGGKGAPAAVKLVDAKFSLPHDSHQHSGEGEEGEFAFPEKVRRKFVNVEGLDYAEEHDDITLGFADEAERDRFSRALPAATSVSRGLTLKRRT